VVEQSAQAARSQRTSGMKAAINGAPHLSIGDGWWAEGSTAATAG
jgi:glucan phosphorylase